MALWLNLKKYLRRGYHLLLDKFMEADELIRLLVLFSKSDENFNDKEFVYILNVAERLGLSQEYIENLIRSPEARKNT